MSAPRLLVTLVLAALALSCHPGKVFIASTGDYADYRRVRIASDVDARMAAAWYYLKERPDGQYHARLKRYFAKAEPVYYKVRRRSLKGLEAYLNTMPDGPHAKEALDELLAGREAARREEAVTRQARQSRLRLDFDKDKRTEAAGLLMWWLTALLDEAVWRVPLSEAPKEFLVRYRLSLPRPECQPHADRPDIELCFKSVTRGFRVASVGGLVDRNIAFDLELDFDGNGKPIKATLAGAALFVGTREAQQQKELDGSDEAVRQDAATTFINQLTQTMADKQIACNGGTDADGHTALDCESMRITLEPGKGTSDDIIYVEPVALADAPPPPPVTPPEGSDGEGGGG